MSNQSRKIAKAQEARDRYVAAVWEHVERGRFLLWAKTWTSQLWRATHWTGLAATAWTLGWFLLCLLAGLTLGAR